MKCPKCGYHSFDYLDTCKKCNHDLAEHKQQFNLRGFFSPELKMAVAPEAVVNEKEAEDSFVEEKPADDNSTDFGFDCVEEEQDSFDSATDPISLYGGSQSVNIDQPFGADCETIPAGSSESADKHGKDPDFSL